jgi:phage-related protein
MTDITKRDTLSMAIFGKSAMDMGPMLNEGSDGIEAMKIKANDLGLVMSDDSVSAGAKFDDMMSTVKSSLGAMVTKIGLEVLPTVQNMLKWVTDHMPQIQAVASTAFDYISKAISFVKDNANWLIPILAVLLGSILALNVINTITSLMTAWKATTFATTLAQQGLNAALMLNPIGLVVLAIGALIVILILAWKNISGFREAVLGAWSFVSNKTKEVFGNYIIPFIKTQLVPLFKKAFQTIQDVVKGAFTIMKWAWDNILKPLLANIIIPFIKNVLLPAWKVVFSGISGAISTAFKTISNLWNKSLKPILNGILDFVSGVFTGNWSKAWDGIKSIFSGVWEGLKTIVKAPLNFIVGGLNGFIRGLNNLRIPDWVPGVGGLSLNLPLIPSFAVGTRYLPKDMLIQAHKGEMIVPESENPYANSGGSITGQRPITVTNMYVQDKGDEERNLAQLQFLSAL